MQTTTHYNLNKPDPNDTYNKANDNVNMDTIDAQMYANAQAAGAAQTTANAAIPSTQKGAANGVSTLDGTGNVPPSQLGNVPKVNDATTTTPGLLEASDPASGAHPVAVTTDNATYKNAARKDQDNAFSVKQTFNAGFDLPSGQTATVEGDLEPGTGGTVHATKSDKLTTARTISLSGDASGSVSFDGSADEAIAVTLANSGAIAGTYPKVTVNAKGLVTGGSALASSDVTGALGYTPSNKAGDSFTGNISAPAVSATGLTGATAGARLVGGTTSGAPASGAWNNGDLSVDQSGGAWVYTPGNTVTDQFQTPTSGSTNANTWAGPITVATQFSFSKNVTLNSFEFYAYQGGSNMAYAIYDASGNMIVPWTTLVAGSGWQTETISGGVALTGGTTYYLAFSANTANDMWISQVTSIASQIWDGITVSVPGTYTYGGYENITVSGGAGTSQSTYLPVVGFNFSETIPAQWKKVGGGFEFTVTQQFAVPQGTNGYNANNITNNIGPNMLINNVSPNVTYYWEVNASPNGGSWGLQLIDVTAGNTIVPGGSLSYTSGGVLRSNAITLKAGHQYAFNSTQGNSSYNNYIQSSRIVGVI